MDRHFTTRAVYSPRPILVSQAVFYFYIFQFRFLQKYIFVFEIYRNIPRPPCGRAAGTWPPRCWAGGVFLQKLSQKICAQVPGGPVARQRGERPPRPPSSGAAGLGRPPAGWPAPPPLYKGWLVPPHLICITKIPETKNIEGERRSPAGFSSWRLQVTKILLRFTNRLCYNYFCWNSRLAINLIIVRSD